MVQSNSGVCHINAIINDYDIQYILFDTFHGRCDVYKYIVSYIGKIIEGSYKVIEKFRNFLNLLKS